ncbi:MAG: serine/threonine-protein kinase [Vicinamibacterales bacterium]
MTTAPAPIGVIAHYNLLERLEPAGPGELFRARDTRLGRTVVIRWLPAEFARDASARAALLGKARGLIPLSHPNVITLFDAGEEQERVYLVFEFLKGQSLRAEMAGRPLNVRLAVDLAVQIADAVADAHAAGYVHGGLSPDSIVITAKGHAKVPAFELAARDGFESAGQALDVRLSDYGSPEEARGEAPDHRSDIYSVGAMLYEMLTNKRPSHRGAGAPSGINPNVPEGVDAVALKAVAPNPDLRHQSAATLAADLRTAAVALDARGAAGSVKPHEHQSTSVGRVIAMSAVILAGVVAILWWFGFTIQ